MYFNDSLFDVRPISVLKSDGSM